MHPDLSPHLHTDECNVIITAYKKCHKEHNFGRFLGYCNELDRALNRCLDGEYEKKRLANKAHADKWRSKVHKDQKATI